MITKHYATLSSGCQTHYRRVAKEGPQTTLIMLHASPMSSEMMLPIMHNLEGVCELIAPDTPGYGQSDPLTKEALSESDTLYPYVEWLNEFIDVLGLESVALYGSATGTQIAIEYARAYPQKTRFLVLDNAADFNDAEREKIMVRYFPDLTPQPDGSHLQAIWEISKSMFQWFPWYQQDDEHRISTETPSLAALQSTVKAYVLAGPEYYQAYKRAFMNEDATRLQAVTVPTTVIRWEGSMIRKYSDRFDQYQWPDNIKMHHCGKSFEERFESIRGIVEEMC